MCRLCPCMKSITLESVLDALENPRPELEVTVPQKIAAHVGLLEDAEPILVPGRRIPHAGVLLAVPALIHSGIFSVADEVYGHIGPAFYGLRTTMMALSLMAMLWPQGRGG